MRTKTDAIREIREEVFHRRGLGWFRVSTGSMRPMIVPGDTMLVRRIAPAEAKLGDILLYREGEVLVAHRLVGFARRGGRELFLVKGDAGAVADELAPEAVRGKVVVIEKEGGGALRLDSPRGRVVDGYLVWKNCRFRRVGAAVERGKERMRPWRAFPVLRFVYRAARLPVTGLQAVFFRIFL